MLTRGHDSGGYTGCVSVSLAILFFYSVMCAFTHASILCRFNGTIVAAMPPIVLCRHGPFDSAFLKGGWAGCRVVLCPASFCRTCARVQLRAGLCVDMISESSSVHSRTFRLGVDPLVRSGGDATDRESWFFVSLMSTWHRRTLCRRCRSVIVFRCRDRKSVV